MKFETKINLSYVPFLSTTGFFHIVHEAKSQVYLSNIHWLLKFGIVQQGRVGSLKVADIWCKYVSKGQT